MVKIRLLKYLDRLLAGLVSCISALEKRTIVASGSFLFIRPGGIGDAVLLIPVIKALRELYPRCVLDVLAEKRNASIFHLTPDVRKVYLYDKISGLSPVLRENYDVVIDTEQWYRLSAVVARLVKAPIKIGFGTNERRRLFTHVIEYDQSAYELDNFASLLKPLGINNRQLCINGALTLQPQSVAKVSQLFQPLAEQPFIVIFPGASISEKRWGSKSFRSVAEGLQGIGYRIIVVGGQEDRSDGDYISNGLGLNLTGETTLSGTSAVIACSKLLISGDSGILHIAAGLGIPTISLFGPSSMEKWAPKGNNHIALSLHLPCSPCSQYGTVPPCPYEARCMQEITVDQVLDAAIGLLKKKAET